MNSWYWPFKHKHRWELVDHKMAPSLATGVPLVVSQTFACRCGAEREEMTDAGYQQSANLTLIADGIKRIEHDG